jgi:hypothetical protein
MRHVGVREFRDKATALLAGDEKLVIERHGTPIGYYVPIKRRDSVKLERDIERFNTVLEKALTETGMTEDEFFNALDKAGQH